MTLVAQILTASRSKVCPVPAWPANIAAINRVSAPKFISVTTAVRAMASHRTIFRSRPTSCNCSFVDALRALFWVQAVAIDNGMKNRDFHGRREPARADR